MRLYLCCLFCIFSFFASGDSYLVVQGLGNKFFIMNDIVEELQLRGHQVFTMNLKGHSKHDYEELKKITAQKWKKQFIQIYESMPKKSRKHFIGYSLGAAIGVDAMSSTDSIVFKTATLLAPAISIQPYIGIVKVLDWLGIAGLPSIAPIEERAHNYIPIETYRALFQVEKNVQKINTGKLKKTRVTILMDSWDMLVSYYGIKKWLKKNKLDTWELLPIDVPRGVFHMATQKKFLPPKSWEAIKKSL